MSVALREAALSRPGQWFGFLGGAVAWMLHLLAVWLISEFGCILNPGSVFGGAMTVVALLIVLATLVFLGMALASTATALLARGDLTEPSDERTESRLFMARGGVYMSASFALIIVVQAVPIFYYFDWC